MFRINLIGICSSLRVSILDPGAELVSAPVLLRGGSLIEGRSEGPGARSVGLDRRGGRTDPGDTAYAASGYEPRLRHTAGDRCGSAASTGPRHLRDFPVP